MTTEPKSETDPVYGLKPPPRPLHLGVIGAGWIARACHLPSLAALRQHGWPVSVAAIADSSDSAIAATMAAVPGLLGETRRFTDGGALLQAASDLHLDAVLLLTPPEVTTRLLRRSMALGLATFAEKPVAEEAAPLAVLAAIGDNADSPPVQVGYNRRWQPLAPAFRDSVSRLQAAETPNLHIEAHLWRAARSEAIFYRDTMIHAVDFLLWCLGPLDIQQVSVWPPISPGGIMAGLRAELLTTGQTEPVTVHLDVRPSVGRSREMYIALGAKASAELAYCAADRDAEPARLSLWGMADADGPEANQPLLCPTAADSNLWSRGFLGQMAGFLSLVGDASRSTNRCTLSDALAARQLTDAILSCEAAPAWPGKR